MPNYVANTPTYELPLLPKVVIKSLDKTETYYTFDPLTYGPNPGGLTYLSLRLGTNQHGTFEIEFEDTNNIIDTARIKPSARVYIYFGKTSGTMYLKLSGMIRGNGYPTRGCENNQLYSINGFGTGVRSNERIMDINIAPTKLLSDGITIDTTDTTFQADSILDDTLDDSSYYPENITVATKEGTGGYGYIDSNTTQTDSPINDFIPGMISRFQEMSDAHNQIESYTGARIYFDTNDKPQLQPLLTPYNSDTGFVIRAVSDKENDLADNTMYVIEDYKWNTSISKDTGFTNGMYGILSSDLTPDKEYFGDTGLYRENKTVEVAQRFRPPTNPNWRIYCAVEGIGMDNVASENSVRGRWRICDDNNGVPKNTGGVIANKYMYPNKYYSTADGGVQTIQAMGLGSVDLDVNKYYWLILASTNATSSVYWRWYKNNNVGGETMTASTGTSSSTDGGSGWSDTSGDLMLFTLARFKAEPFCMFDQKSISENILIESVANSFPQQITSKLGAVKYLVGLMQYAPRPRKIFAFPSLTIPNKPVNPGDIAYIVDPRFKFGTPGFPIVTGPITDIAYSFGSQGSGSGRGSGGMTSLSLNVVAYNQSYR